MKKNKAFLIIIAIILIATGAIICTITNYKTPVSSLSNPDSTETTKRIYSYLCTLSGEGVLTAQQESTWRGSSEYEMDYIYSASGKYPAMRGLDYMNDDFEGVNERAIEWWNKGGLVTICWHTGADFSGEWKDASNDEIADWEAVLTDGTAENKQFIEGMDKAAKALLQLQEQGVTVIWRPFHEFDGGWFWWGKGGPENFVKLWKLMYERYTDYWHLNNLIWVLGYSHNGEDYRKWYPSAEYFDIIGADSYDGGAQPKLYRKVSAVNKGNKPMCFHECGANPTEAELRKTKWIWFMTWHTEYLTDNNSKEEINALYNSDYAVTLDELPNFQATPAE